MEENIVWVHESSVIRYTSELLGLEPRPVPFTGTTTRHIIGTIFKALETPGVGIEVPTCVRDCEGENAAAGIHAVLNLLQVEHTLDWKVPHWVLRITPMEKNMEKYRKMPFDYFFRLNKMTAHTRYVRLMYDGMSHQLRSESDLPEFQYLEYRP